MVHHEQENKQLEEDVSILLRDLGIPSDISGYKYLQSAILLCMEDSTLLNSILKRLYPTIAKKYNTTPKNVENLIRYAIKTICLNGNIDFINSIFVDITFSNTFKLSNSNFIATIVDKLTEKEDLEKEISTMLRNLGIYCKLSGYQYLQSAILLCMEDSTFLNSTPKRLYSTIAQKYNNSPSGVERSIRYAIETGCKSGNKEIINSLFGSAENTRPTSSIFIATIVDELHSKLE